MSGIDFGLARSGGAGNFTGDAKSDVFWRHATQGEAWVWLMDSATRLSETWVATVADIGYRPIVVR